MNHRLNDRANLINEAVDHALGIEPARRRHDRLGIQRELEDVVGLNQLGPARARQEITSGVVGMTYAHVPEGIEHVLVGEDAVGARKLAPHVVEIGQESILPAY